MPRSLSNPTTPTAAAKPAVKAKDRDPVAAGQRDASFNRSASFNYFLGDRYECGVALRGTEVKSIREGKANLKDAYGLLKDGEAFLLNAHIGPFSHGNMMNHESLRTRKLLLHRREIEKLTAATQGKGTTLIPVRLYFRNGRVNPNSLSRPASSSGTSARPNVNARPTRKLAPRSRAANVVDHRPLTFGLG